jgi:YD repeat-containing protein
MAKMNRKKTIICLTYFIGLTVSLMGGDPYFCLDCPIATWSGYHCGYEVVPKLGPTISIQVENIKIIKHENGFYSATPGRIIVTAGGEFGRYVDNGTWYYDISEIARCWKIYNWIATLYLEPEENKYIGADFQAYRDWIWVPFSSPGKYYIKVNLGYMGGIDENILPMLKSLKFKVKAVRFIDGALDWGPFEYAVCDCWWGEHGCNYYSIAYSPYFSDSDSSGTDFSGYVDELETITVGVDVVEGCDGGGGGGGGGGECERLSDTPISGCSGCNQDGDNCSNILTIGNASALVKQTQSDTMSFYASLLDNDTSQSIVEANIEGAWIKYSEIEDYDTDYDYNDTDANNITVSVAITNPDNETYIYDANGLWPDYITAIEDLKGRIPLREVQDSSGHTKLTYDYDYTNNKVIVTSKTYIGSNQYRTDGYLVFQGGVDLDKPEEMLSRIWAGKNLTEYSATGEPASGKWMDLETQIMPNSGLAYITKVSYCGSCNGAAKNYSYVESQINRNYTYEDVTPVELPSSFKLSKVSDAGSNVLVSYDYDQDDQYKRSFLGDHDKLVSKWFNEDIDFEVIGGNKARNLSAAADEVVLRGNNYLLRCDYTDENVHSAKEYIYDDFRRLTKKRLYHNLQTGAKPSGAYSETTYSYKEDGSGRITQIVTTLPDKTRIYDFYSPVHDGAGNVISVKLTKRIKNGVVEFERAYKSVRTHSVVLDWSISQEGGETEYTYNARGQVLTRKAPAPGVFGKTGEDNRLITYYEYEDFNNPDRVTKEWTSDGKVPACYTYDEFGNLKTRSVGNLTTYYEYNEYNEQILSYDSAGNDIRNIQRKFYSNTGTVIAEAAYLDKDDFDTAVSATYYIYDNNGRLVTKKTAKTSSPFTFNGSDPGASTDWVNESYQYDTYGRRTAVITDSGTGGKNLTTTYEYNNQSEIIRVTTPDQYYTETVRDGRGLVIQTINGIKSYNSYDPKTITHYFYDLNGNLVKKKDPAGVCENYNYDKAGRKVRTWKTKE